MTPQEYIFKMLAREGDCWHEQKTKFTSGWLIGDGCKHCNKYDRSFNIGVIKDNIDLTTPDGAFWIMSRLEGWDRFEEFCEWLEDCEDNRVFAVNDTLKWLASDAKNGKAPALFNALCSFLNLKPEEI